LPPTPATLAATPYWVFHHWEVEQRRAQTIINAARHAKRLEEAVTMEPADAERRIRALPGLGAWTYAEVAVVALGDADAVSVGDYHLPHLVGWALAGEERATDERMLELLEPYRGHRARVVQLLELSGVSPPRRGPRLALQRIARI
jgi:3-methyladenine DNA glycosylase/8-oxoguanine DNA glycosylase